MADTKPGDGNTNPFGNGQGKGRNENMGGNDFTRNPRGGGGNAPKPRSFVGDGETGKQASGQGPNPESIPSGGRFPFTPPKADEGNPLGDGSQGTARKPFKLNE